MNRLSILALLILVLTNIALYTNQQETLDRETGLAYSRGYAKGSFQLDYQYGRGYEEGYAQGQKDLVAETPHTDLPLAYDLGYDKGFTRGWLSGKRHICSAALQEGQSPSLECEAGSASPEPGEYTYE